MKTKHIAMFISSLNKGGSERVLVNLAEYFYNEGYQVTIVTQYETDNEYPISEGIKRVLSDITENETIFPDASLSCETFGKKKNLI